MNFIENIKNIIVESKIYRSFIKFLKNLEKGKPFLYDDIEDKLHKWIHRIKCIIIPIGKVNKRDPLNYEEH